MPAPSRSRLDYKVPALQQTQIFAATRAVRKCQRIIREKWVLLEELKQSGDQEAIAALERELSDL